MTERIRQVADLILEIERQLRLLDRWSDIEPTQEQLDSVQPFALDTLSFDEWLQFIFLPRIKLILEQGGGLPRQSQIAPMAEVYYKGIYQDASNAQAIIDALTQFDDLINCA